MSNNTKQLNFELYKKLYLVRKAENVICQKYLEDKMKTPMHMSKGGEAISVGICHALRKEDQILGTYRSHAIYLAKVGETDQFFAEMYGRATGMVKGKGGSMHLIAPAEGFICSSAIVATTIPVAVGAAFANKSANNQKVSVVFFGDGAIDEGAFWESVNVASLMKLPVVFVCEDNDIAVHSPGHHRHGYKSISEVVSKFDCDVYTSESTDVEEIYNLSARTIEAVRKSQKPAFMHLKYYRYLEHVGVFEDFKAGYRDKKIYEAWLEKDPLDLQRKKIQQWFSEAEIKNAETAIDKQVDDSVASADSAPFPGEEVTYEDVLA